ncbi:ABC-F family ATP-binding cassette domain-containing protein [Sphingomonas sp. ASY06-1R]|uniref:ABC-F family ATP-binding cassette domain-containing protein n=1 Tax=Sphingomonas sp. ASY06-1R TaxID=3445771 RepID=UPI003FA2C79B
MPSITASGLSWSTPDGRRVLQNVDLHLTKERVGLVGRNGVGKTSLLHLLSGDHTPSSGTLVIDGTIRLMRQELRSEETATIADLFNATDALRILRRAETGDASIDELAEADWTIDERIREALARVELDADSTTLLAMLSGGQRTRASLAAAIFAAPDFLLLDEPTNNLDRDGRGAVMRLVESWTSGLVVISHDRELLERVDAIVEMTSIGASRYGGNWTAYRARKAVELDAAERDLNHARKQQADIARKSRIAAERQTKRDAAGSRKAARGDMPRILIGARKNAAEASAGSGRRLNDRLADQAADAVDTARARIEVLQQLSIVLPSTHVPAGRTLLDLRGVAGGYDPAAPLFDGLDLTIVGPQRVAIVGPNGAGKSTLLKLVAGLLAPLAGQVRATANATMIDQHMTFLDPAASILDNFRRLNPGADENACRSILAGFLFRADAALQRVGSLSGGQTLRAGLACKLGGPRPPELLILDEPTNHLDLDSIHAVEAALQAYDGALLIVSHDEAFLDAIAIARRVRLGAQGGRAHITLPAMVGE